MKYVYLLRATGIRRFFNQKGTVSNTVVHTSEERAESLIPEFRAVVTDMEKLPLTSLYDDDHLEIEVVPLEVIE